jgi:hypothetical protein
LLLSLVVTPTVYAMLKGGQGSGVRGQG